MFVKLTLHPSGEQKFYNMRYVKSFRQGTYSTILELPEGTENVKEKAKDIYRILNGEAIPEVGNVVRVHTDKLEGRLGRIAGMQREGEDVLYEIEFGSDEKYAVPEDYISVVRR